MSNKIFPIESNTFLMAEMFHIDLFQHEADGDMIYHPTITLILDSSSDDIGVITLDTNIFLSNPTMAIFAAYRVGLGLCNHFDDLVMIFDEDGDVLSEEYSLSDVIQEIYDTIEASRETVPEGTTIH